VRQEQKGRGAINYTVDEVTTEKPADVRAVKASAVRRMTRDGILKQSCSGCISLPNETLVVRRDYMEERPLSVKYGVKTAYTDRVTIGWGPYAPDIGILPISPPFIPFP